MTGSDSPRQQVSPHAKVLDAAYIKDLLAGKRQNESKPQKPKPDNTPARLDYDYDDDKRPEWHKWVYGGQRNPYI